jgi:hypothetical protein
VRVFAELGRRVERGWTRGRDLARLPAIAAAALRAVRVDDVDPLAVAQQAASASTGVLPPQLPVDFGDAQVTVWRGEHVLVQLVYWLHETTAIHQHGFAGAFRVLAGASMHSTHRFTDAAGKKPSKLARRVVARPRVRVGELVQVGRELLSPGDVREIGAGTALVHNLVHVEMPSVTLVVRTPFSDALAPQWQYHPPGVAVDPEPLGAETRARLRLLVATARLDADRALAIARTLVARGVDDSWYALSELARSAARTDEALAPFAALVLRRHGAAGRVIVDAVKRMRVRRRLFGLRDTVASRPHRTLLALLGDGAGRAEAIAAIAALFPERPPTEQLERWLVELAPALGMANLDRGAARVFRRTVEGATVRDIVAELAAARIEGYPAATVRAVADAFRGSPLFASLFAD